MNCPALICVCLCARTTVYLSSCERWLGTHNRHALAGQHKIAVVNYRPKLPQSLRVTAVWHRWIVLLTVPFWGSAPVMYTKNSIKRLYSPAADRAFDGLLPSSMRSNIPSLKLLHTHRPCALSEFTSDCLGVFFLMHASALLLCIWFIPAGKRKET